MASPNSPEPEGHAPITPVRLGIIGAGPWCRAAHLPGLMRNPNVELAAVACSSMESSRAAAELFGIERAHDHWRSVVAQPLDAILIATPAVQHAEIAIAALEAGKHVFCEAPLAMDSAEARAMLAAAENAGRVAGYSLPRPYLYGGERMRELLSENAIGSLDSGTLSVRGNTWLLADPAQQWRARATAVPPLLVGVVTGVLGALCGEVARVCAKLERIAPPAGDGSFEPAPDYFGALFEFRSGLRMTIDAGVSPRPVPGSGLTLFGRDGMLAWDWTRPGAIELTRFDSPEPRDHSVVLEADLSELYPFSREFVAALGSTGKGNTEHTPGFRAGLHELLVIEACQSSARNTGWVDVEAP